MNHPLSLDPQPDRISFEFGKWPKIMIVSSEKHDWKQIVEKMRDANFIADIDLNSATDFTDQVGTNYTRIPMYCGKRPGDELKFELFKLIQITSEFKLDYSLFVEADPYQGCYGLEDDDPYILEFNISNDQMRFFQHTVHGCVIPSQKITKAAHIL